MAEQAKDKRASFTDSHSSISHSISDILGLSLIHEPEAETESEMENTTSEYQEKESNMKKMVDQDDTSPSSPVLNQKQSKPCPVYTYVTKL